MIDTQVEGGVSVSDVHVVREFPYVFSKDLPGVPPVIQIEFRVDLILSASPISKVLYRLAPPEMRSFRLCFRSY